MGEGRKSLHLRGGEKLDFPPFWLRRGGCPGGDELLFTGSVSIQIAVASSYLPCLGGALFLNRLVRRNVLINIESLIHRERRPAYIKILKFVDKTVFAFEAFRVTNGRKIMRFESFNVGELAPTRFAA